MSKSRPTAPAVLPLAGGRPEATLKLRPLLCAELGMPPYWFHRRGGLLATPAAYGVGLRAKDLLTIPIVAYLIEHPQAGLILVDTGLDASIAGTSRLDRVRNLGVVGELMARHASMRVEQTAAAQLRALGVNPAEIELVVMTHLHFDHASALCDFPRATVLVDQREWHAAWARGSSLNGYCRAQFAPSLRYRTIDFSAPAAVPRGPFERTVDLFGDGSLILLSTPGHTAGHLSLIARLEGREALLTADAAYTLGTIRAGERPWRTHDTHAFERSLGQIQAYDRENPDALVVPGHDLEAWRTICAQLSE
jgi:N-acyl homoserine lactone hydrolase